MAILFMEGFDGYADGDAVAEDSRIALGDIPLNFSLVTGRNGSGQALRTRYNTGDIYCHLKQESDSTIWVQFAFQYVTGTWVSTEQFIDLYNADGTTQGSVWLTASGELEYRSGTTTVLGTTGAANISTASWYYIELKVFHHASTGTVDILIDGVSVLSLTSQNTLASGSGTISNVKISHNDDDTIAYELRDDIVIGDGSGTDATDLIGECAIELLSPDGAGNYAQWTPSTGSNYQNVDEAPSSSDGDTTYNSSSTAAQKDTFTTGNLSVSTGSIYAVQVGYIGRREDGGGRTIRGMIRTSSTDASGTSVYTPSSYIHRHDIFENDAGGTDWTISSVNAMEIGYELVT